MPDLTARYNLIREKVIPSGGQMSRLIARPAAQNPLGRVGEHSELANLASVLISDQADYINGEMVVQDGGAHLWASGAEDLLQWSDAQWAAHAKA